LKKPLRRTDRVLRTANGQLMRPLGVVTLWITYRDQRKPANLYITEAKDKVDPLFGREWMMTFVVDWATEFALNKTPVPDHLKSKENSSVQKLTAETQQALLKLVKKYPVLFEPGIGRLSKDFTFKLNLSADAKPIKCKPRPIPYALEDRVKKQCDEWEELGIWKKIEYSEWATPMVIAPKSDGGIRICGDYKVTLNKFLKLPTYPIPTAHDLEAKLGPGDKYTKMDIVSAFLHVPVDEETGRKMAIVTPWATYECLAMVFGASPEPQHWQHCIEKVLDGIPGVAVFFDDLIITAPDDATHLERLELVFKRFAEHGIRVNLKKTRFMEDKVSYLGHTISSEGVHKTDESVKAIVDLPRPKCTKDVRSFLGKVTFYTKFCPDLATLAHPLYELLQGPEKKEGDFEWSTECDDVYRKVKDELCSDRVLVHYDPKKPLVLATDASQVGVGAVLSHVYPDGTERPIWYANKRLSKIQRKYSNIEREALAIFWATKYFFKYLFGRRFTLITDNEPLVAIFGDKKGLPKLSAMRLFHYALYLQNFQFDIKYRKTDLHGNADCLSRLPPDTTIDDMVLERDEVDCLQMELVETMPIAAADIAREIPRDPEFGPIYIAMMEGKPLHQDPHQNHERLGKYAVEDGCLLYKHRVCIPEVFRQRVLEELHEGHFGVVKTKALARGFCYWPNVDSDIEHLVESCEQCKVHKTKQPRHTTHHWEYPAAPWERIHVDFAGPFLDRTMLIVVDAHSKWLEVEIMPKEVTSAATIGKLRTICARFGLPKVLMSDNGTQFTSDEFETWCLANGIKHKTCAQYHPATNGQAERYVATVKQQLKTLKAMTGTLQEKLDLFLLYYRKMPNTTTGLSPAQMLMKRDLRIRLDLMTPDVAHRLQEKIRSGRVEFEDKAYHSRERVLVQMSAS
jgi:hypothetical protein